MCVISKLLTLKDGGKNNTEIDESYVYVRSYVRTLSHRRNSHFVSYRTQTKETVDHRNTLMNS